MTKPRDSRRPAIVNDGELKYFAAENTVVFVQTPFVRVKVCRIIFGQRDGSIYVDFPYLVAKEGLLSEVSLPPKHDKPHELDLRKNGKHVTTDVKFAHHTSGIAHFSKTGWTSRLPERRSFPLATSIGAVFEVSIFWLHALADLDHIKGRDAHVGFRFADRALNSICVRAEWRRKDDIAANREDLFHPVGPETTGVHRKTGAVTFFRMLGQPRGFPLQDHILLICAYPIEMASPDQGPGMVFFGGWNEHEQTAEHPERYRHTCLAFMYPASASGGANATEAAPDVKGTVR
jgi:hypothetical protein